MDAIQLYRIDGKLLQTIKANAQTFTVNTSMLAAGVYFIEVKTGTEKVVKKVVKM